MVIMILLTVGSAIAANPEKFSVASLTLLGIASVGYVLWNLAGTKGIVALVVWEKATLPPVKACGPRWSVLTYITVQIMLSGLVYLTADRGHTPNLIWLVLLPPVAYAVFLLDWRGITFVSFFMTAFLGASVYRWQGLTYTVFADVAFSFAVLFTLVF